MWNRFILQLFSYGEFPPLAFQSHFQAKFMMRSWQIFRILMIGGNPNPGSKCFVGDVIHMEWALRLLWRNDVTCHFSMPYWDELVNKYVSTIDGEDGLRTNASKTYCKHSAITFLRKQLKRNYNKMCIYTIYAYIGSVHSSIYLNVIQNNLQNKMTQKYNMLLKNRNHSRTSKFSR